MQAALENRSTLEVELRISLSKRQFALFYQIQVNSDNRPIGAEVLLRWIHPIRGVVPPDEFIPLAEDTGLILPIGLWVLETACAQIKAWEANPLVCELQIAINVSARQFHQTDFVEQVREVLTRTGAAANRLKIELTESVVLDNINDTIAKMHDLKQLGVRFSMDDFGTGYSSLAYLTQLPLDQLKIDRSFVRNIGTKHTDAVIVQTIIGMGNSLGMEVIAEGVETEAQRAFLEHAGCIAYQGYLFSKPVPLDEFENVLLSGGFARDRAGV
jgi:EAL domain-containing protein (putative c-di-GMP-specific phosphodiesterase class I)